VTTTATAATRRHADYRIRTPAVAAAIMAIAGRQLGFCAVRLELSVRWCQPWRLRSVFELRQGGVEPGLPREVAWADKPRPMLTGKVEQRADIGLARMRSAEVFPSLAGVGVVRKLLRAARPIEIDFEPGLAAAGRREQPQTHVTPLFPARSFRLVAVVVGNA